MQKRKIIAKKIEVNGEAEINMKFLSVIFEDYKIATVNKQ